MIIGIVIATPTSMNIWLLAGDAASNTVSDGGTMFG